MGSAPALSGPSGEPLDAIGKTVLNLPHFLEYQEFVVIKNLNREMILGMDFMERGQGKLDLGTREVTVFGKRVILGRSALQLGQIMHVSSAHKRDFPSVFPTEQAPLGYCSVDPIRIKTHGPPIKQRAYRVPLRKAQIIEEEVEKMLKLGVIRPSSSPWSSPVTLVPKKTGETRFCVDYKKLNAVTEKDSFPLPLMQEIFDTLRGSTVFSLIDLKSSYWQIPVHEKDIPKTAFVCHLGLYEFLRCPYGLANGPANFQRTMSKVLTGLTGKLCMAYIDDIVVFSPNPEQHEKDVREVLSRLKGAGLKVREDKCSFNLPEVELLGYVVSAKGISPNPDKCRVIKELPAPRDKKEVRSFLGMTNYYRQCMPDYAKIAAPLVTLTRKSVAFHFDQEEREAFSKLKSLLISDRVMSYPRVGQPYKLYTDACGYAVGAILVQEDDNGVERVIHYVSRQLSGLSGLRWKPRPTPSSMPC